MAALIGFPLDGGVVGVGGGGGGWVATGVLPAGTLVGVAAAVVGVAASLVATTEGAVVGEAGCVAGAGETALVAEAGAVALAAAGRVGVAPVFESDPPQAASNAPARAIVA